MHLKQTSCRFTITAMRVLFCFFLVGFSYAQAQISTWNHSSFRVENGLPGLRVGAIQQDHRGFIWMLTAGGLCRFDGRTFDRLLHDARDSTSPPNDYLTDLMRLPDNRMLVTTTQGLYVFDTETFRGKRIAIKSPFPTWTTLENITKDIILFPQLHKIAVRSETSWIYYDDTLSNPVAIRYPYASDDVNKEMRFTNFEGIPDADGNILTTTNYSTEMFLVDFKLRKMQPMSRYPHHAYADLANYKHFDQLSLDSSRNIWFHCYGKDSLYCLKPYGKTIAYFLPHPFNKVHWFGQISFPHPNKMLWSYNRNGIAYLYELPYQRMLRSPGITVYPVSYTGLSVYNYSVFSDRDQNCWIAHKEGLELVRHNYKILERVDLPVQYQKENELQWVNDLYYLSPDSILIAANGEGLFLYLTKMNEVFKLSDPTRKPPKSPYLHLMNCLIPLQGNRILVQGTQNHTVNQMKLLKGFKPLSAVERVLVNQLGNSVFQDSKKNVWVSTTDSGVLRISHDGSQDTTLKNNSFFKWSKVEGFGEDADGTIWFANRVNSELYSYSYLSGLGKKIKLPENAFIYITNLACVGNELIYLSDVNGMGSYNRRNGEVKRYLMADGFPSREISNLVYLPPFIIATTPNGCYFLHTQNNSHFVLDHQDGIVDNLVTGATLYDSLNKCLYVGGNACLYKLDISILLDPLPQFNVYIENIRIHNSPIPPEQLQSDLPADKNTISFRVKSVDFHSRNNRHFVYRIVEDGDTSVWMSHTGEEFSFNNLSAGEYVILVRGIDKNGQRSSNTASLKFRILLPWYYRAWFLLVVFSIPLLVIWAFYRYKMLQYKKVLAIRNQLSRDLHDDLGSTLSSINILSKQGANSNQGSLEILRKINERSSRLLSTMKDIIWNIQPQSDQLEEVLHRLRSYASEVFEAKGIEYEIRFPAEEQPHKIDFEVKHALFLISKEAINNLIKYSHCRFARVEIYFDGNRTLAGTISDDGVGFDVDMLEHIGGITNIVARARDAGGYAEVCSEPTKGTKVKFRFPI